MGDYRHLSRAFSQLFRVAEDKPTAPEFFQGPVMRGAVLLILHLHGDDGSGERSPLPLFGHTGGQQVRRQRRVEGVGQQDELELHLWVKQRVTRCHMAMFVFII